MDFHPHYLEEIEYQNSDPYEGERLLAQKANLQEGIHAILEGADGELDAEDEARIAEIQAEIRLINIRVDGYDAGDVAEEQRFQAIEDAAIEAATAHITAQETWER